MRSNKYDEQNSNEVVQDQITTQDANLMHELVLNNSTTHHHSTFSSKSSLSCYTVELNNHLNPSHYKAQTQQALSQHSRLHVTLCHNDIHLCKQAKIKSVVYQKRSESIQKNMKNINKQKLSISLINKGRRDHRQQLMPESDCVPLKKKQTKQNAIQYKNNADMKEQSQNHKHKIRKIKQPLFHNRHPLQNHNHNGAYLSQLIISKVKANHKNFC